MPTTDVLPGAYRETHADLLTYARGLMADADKVLALWRDLEPVVRDTIALYAGEVAKARAANAIDLKDARQLLESQAKMVEQVSRAAQSQTRIADMVVRMKVLLEGPPQHRDAAKMAEGELVETVVKTVKVLRDERGICPVCGTKTGKVIATQ